MEAVDHVLESRLELSESNEEHKNSLATLEQVIQR
jgi:hypothetical protein